MALHLSREEFRLWAASEIISRVINIGSIVLDPPGITIDLADLYPASV